MIYMIYKKVKFPLFFLPWPRNEKLQNPWGQPLALTLTQRAPPASPASRNTVWWGCQKYRGLRIYG